MTARRRSLCRAATLFLALALSATAAKAQTVGMVVDNNSKDAIVFDTETDTVTGVVSLGVIGGVVGDCIVADGGRLGLVTDYSYQLWAINLTTSPPILAGAPNPIVVANQGADIALTTDGQFAVVCDSATVAPISVVDVQSRTQVSTLDLGTDCNAVDVCDDSSILVSSYRTSSIRRLTIDAGGTLTDTGETFTFANPINITCAPGSQAGIALSTFGSAQGFRLGGMTAGDPTPLTGRPAISAIFNSGGTRLYVRSNNAVDIFDFDPATATIGASPPQTIPLTFGASGLFGTDQMALDLSDAKLYVPQTRSVNVYDAMTGELLTTFDDPAMISTTGICVHRAQDSDGDGLSDGAEEDLGTDPLDPDTDGDGLLDGFEVKFGLDPLTPGDGNLDPDADGLENLREQTLRTNPTDADTDDDGLLDGDEVDVHGTDPRNPDSDEDGLDDGQEVNDHGTDPLDDDTDDGGAPDGQEIDDGTDPLEPDDDLVYVSFALSLVDGGGATWRIWADGGILSGSVGPFDYGFRLNINNQDFPPFSQGRTGPDGREIRIGPADQGGLRVSRRVYVPGDESFVRFLEIIENPTGETRMAGIRILSDLSSGFATEVVLTSSGDTAFDPEDDFIVTDDADGSGHLAIVHVFSGGGAVLEPSTVATTAPGGDRVSFSFDLELPAGERAIIMHFGSQSATRALAAESAETLHRLLGRALDGLSESDRDAVANFEPYPDTDGDGLNDEAEATHGTDPENPDTDGGGLLDGYEVTHGFDPLSPADDTGDPDGDGLDNVGEQAAGTEPHDPDSDDDGLWDGFEVDHGFDPLQPLEAGLDPDSDGLDNLGEQTAGTHPRDPDSDDDGLRDGFEVEYGFNPLTPGDESGDADSDGLTNLHEQEIGTDPTDADSDNDTLSDGDEVLVIGTNPLHQDSDNDAVPDGSDNCPLVSNEDQRDRVNPNGVGDACEDSDGDSFSDLMDTCPLVPDAGQADQDGDGVGDACDPYPAFWILVVPVTPFGAVAGESTSITYRLENTNGMLLSDLVGIRFTLTVDGQATFGASASVGTILAGGGTNRALVEFDGGLVRLELLDAIPEVVTLGGDDSERMGIRVRSEVFHDFETGDGQFMTRGEGSSWAHGIPTSGPGGAASGERAWATNLDGDYGVNSDNQLLTPIYSLHPDAGPWELGFRSYLREWDDEIVRFDVSTDGGTTWNDLGILTLGSRYSYVSVGSDLSAFAGQRLRFRFRIISNSVNPHQGWYVDDFHVVGLAQLVEFFTRDGDDDDDGLTNAEEVVAGTNPREEDSDGDGLTDREEVMEHGTDPLSADTDGGGTADAQEVADGTDPLVPEDDVPLITLGMTIDRHSLAYVFDTVDDGIFHSVSLGGSSSQGLESDCVISRPYGLGFAEIQGALRAIDLTATPPRRADPGWEFARPGRAGDLAVTVDGEYLLACDSPQYGLTAWRLADRERTGDVGFGATCVAVDVCSDGSVLVASGWTIRRLLLGQDGTLTDTGESIDVRSPRNVYCAPDGRTGVALGEGAVSGEVILQSFTVPVLLPLDQLLLDNLPSPSSRLNSGQFSLDGRRLYVRPSYSRWIDRYDYDPETGIIGREPAFSIETTSTNSWMDGFEQFALDFMESKIFISSQSRFEILDAGTGESLSWRYIPNRTELAGVCTSSPMPARDADGDGVPDAAESDHGTDPDAADTDGDGLLDGWELRFGTDPLAAGDEALDPDGDGLDNASEQSAGTFPGDPDTDDDGLGDGEELLVLGTNPRSTDTDKDDVADGDDNCPVARNTRQLDVAHPDGIGDACDDPDGDAVFDSVDNCIDAQNTGQEDADHDGLGDACDPYPQTLLIPRPEAPRYALTDRSVPVPIRLEDQDGVLRSDLAGIRLGLDVNGSAVIQPSAEGLVVSGAGTGHVIAEFIDGLLTVEISDPLEESVVLRASDSLRLGMEPLTLVFEDFEEDDGGFTGSPYHWEHGEPTSGPGAAFSGTKVWATNLDGPNYSGAFYRLISPVMDLERGGRGQLRFRHWFDAGTCCSHGEIYIRGDDISGWILLDRISGRHGGYHQAVYDLTPYTGAGAQIIFQFNGSGSGGGDGWYIDDFVLRGDPPHRPTTFLHPEIDADGDGLTNQQEVLGTTDPYDPDCDDDGVLDGQDNCPLVPNIEQLDTVHPNGIGDMCEDPDEDGIVDRHDNCPDTPNVDQGNADDDGLGDACDPLPQRNLYVIPDSLPYLLTGETLSIACRLEDPDGVLVEDLTGIRFTLALDGSAVFGEAASEGEMLAGGGSSRVLLEVVDGLVTVEAFDTVAERVRLIGEDTEGLGIQFPVDVLELLEETDGGFTHSGTNDPWEHGTPTAGPGQAFSGLRVWATILDDLYPDNSDGTLQAPGYRIPLGSRPFLQFQSAFYPDSYRLDRGFVEVSTDGESWIELDEIQYPSGGYALKSYKLAPYAGSRLHTRFRFTSNNYGRASGWFIDDFAIAELAPSALFLDPAGNHDTDLLTNGEEMALGTDPTNPDTDGDFDQDHRDNCPLTPNPSQQDVVHPNGIGDACDDPDGDGVFDAADNCADAHNPSQSDFDGDLLGDACDPDADNDGVPNAGDNCPLLVNPDQYDNVHPNGIGDACEDPDEDGVMDLTDNCPDTANADQANGDSDNLGDACDPFPDHAIRVRPEVPDFLLTGEPASVAYRLQNRHNNPITDLDGVRTTLTLDGSAVFGMDATHGLLLEGGGTNRALVEFVDGLVTLEVLDPQAGLVTFSGEDTEGNDAQTAAIIVEDFEAHDGGFSHAGINDTWEWGHSVSDPDAGATGRLVWATSLDGFYAPNSDASLVSPPYELVAAVDPALQFRVWTETPGGDREYLEVSTDGGHSWESPLYNWWSTTVYYPFTVNLSAYAGSTVQIRIRFTSDDTYERLGVYLDELVIQNVVRRAEFLSPDIDSDGDGLSSSEELALGSHPYQSDTDRDGTLDSEDNCPTFPNPDQNDSVHPNDRGDACDDPDQDGVVDSDDNCPDTANPDQTDDVHPNDVGDACDDPDNDGVLDQEDNCPDAANSPQIDTDGEGLGDVCDVCPHVANPEQLETVTCASMAEDAGQCLETWIDPIGGVRGGEITLLSTPRTVPHSLTFRTQGSSCYSVDSLEIELNDVLLVVQPIDPAGDCSCTPPVQEFTFDNAARLQEVWKRDGENEFLITKKGNGSKVGWISVELTAPEITQVRCLTGTAPWACEVTDICESGYFGGHFALSPTLVEPLTVDATLSTISFGHEIPATLMDISGVENGEGRLCVKVESTSLLYGSSREGKLFVVNTQTGGGTVVGQLPAPAVEIEYDNLTGRAFMMAAGEPFLLHEFDIADGSGIGEPVPTDALFTGLEFIGSTLYGASAPEDNRYAWSTLETLDPLTGLSTVIGETGVRMITGLAYDESSGRLYAVTRMDYSALISIDPVTLWRDYHRNYNFGFDSLQFGPRGYLYAGRSESHYDFLYRIETANWHRTRLLGSPGFDGVTGLTLVESPPPGVGPVVCYDFVATTEEDLAINGAACGPPTAVAQALEETECSSPEGAVVTLDGSGSWDPNSTPGTNDDIVLFEWFEEMGQQSERFLGTGQILETLLALGHHDIGLRVTDSFGETSLDELAVTVVDTTPPEMVTLLEPSLLWPPNHRMTDITAMVSATDRCGSASVALLSITSNEPDDLEGRGDGDTVDDIKGVEPGLPDFSFSLRAERDGEGNGRVYTVVYQAVDELGNSAEDLALVTVPHDQGGKVEPVTLSVQEDGSGTVVAWNAAEGALFYNAIRGDLAALSDTGTEFRLGDVDCLGSNILGLSTEGAEDSDLPEPGGAFFYLVEYNSGWLSSYGSESLLRPRVVGAGGCQ